MLPSVVRATVLALVVLPAASRAADAGLSTPGTNNYPSGGMLRLGAIAAPGDPIFRSAAYDAANGFAYFGTDTVPGQVVKVDMATFTVVDTITLNAGENNLVSAVLVPGAVLFGTVTSPGIVVKIDTATFTVAGSLTLNAGEDALRDATVDPATGTAYFMTNTAPGRVVKVAPEPLARVDALSLQPGEDSIIASLIDPVDNTLIVGTFSQEPGRVIKIDLATFTRVDDITLQPGENQLRCELLDEANRLAYFGCATTPGQIVRIDLATFTRTGALTLPPGEGSIRVAALDAALGAGYFGSDSIPSRVVKVDLPTFTRTGALVLPASESKLYGGFLQPATHELFFGTQATPTGRIVRLATTQSGVLKATRLTMTEPGILEDVRLYSHLAVGSLRFALYDDAEPKALLWDSGAVLNAAEDAYLAVPVGDGTPTSLFLPAGDYWIAWQSDTIAPVPSYTAGAPADGIVFAQPFGAAPGALASTEITTTDERWTQFLTYNTNFVGPTAPTLRPVLGVAVKDFATTPYGDDVLYRYTWSSDGGDPVVVRGPQAAYEDFLRHGEEGVTLDEGETWTVVVEPVGALGGAGATATGTFVLGPGPTTTFTGWFVN